MGDMEIDSQTTITESGRYTLTQDVENGGGTHLSEPYIRIESNDVVLDGNGVTIGGGGVSDTTGIEVANVRNVTIKNVTLERWDYGIRFENVAVGEIRNARVVGNGYGISFENTDLVLLSKSRAARNVLGVVVDHASEVAFWKNTVEGNISRDVYRSPKGGE